MNARQMIKTAMRKLFLPSFLPTNHDNSPFLSKYHSAPRFPLSAAPNCFSFQENTESFLPGSDPSVWSGLIFAPIESFF
jgi:hypothetical protein